MVLCPYFETESMGGNIWQAKRTICRFTESRLIRIDLVMKMRNAIVKGNSSFNW